MTDMQTPDPAVVDASLADRVYQALAGTTDPWGGCDRREEVERIVDLIVTETAPEPCVMTHEEPYDFGECETHDLSFPLGGTCKYDGRVPLEVAQDEADEQRARAVRAEHELAIARETPSLPDIEVVSARVHEAWMATKRAQGVESRPSEWGEEQMVPYADLSERAKDLDRGTVRSVYAAIEAAGATLPIDRERP